nr:ribonuclease H-like domain-containing protein [Tanacetum cinerariifolium]
LSIPSPQITLTPPTTPPPPPPTSQHPMVTRSKVEIVKANPKYNFHVTTSSHISKSPFHALRDPNWKQAMCDEYKALIDNDTWDKLSRSSAEAEYRGVANSLAETSWIRNLLRELHIPLFTTTLVYRDNVSAVYMSANTV